MMEIADLRHSTGLSQREFADMFGIPVRTLQQWEQGKSSPPPYVIDMIERLIGVSKPCKSVGQADLYSIPEKKIWKVCIEDPFENCERIYPIQQRKVKSLIDDIVDDNEVRSIIVFGSSITERCHIGSDVDIYVDIDAGANLISETHDFTFDLWTTATADDRLKDEIFKKGVRVYG